LKRGQSVSLSSGIINRVDHYIVYMILGMLFGVKNNERKIWSSFLNLYDNKYGL
jgi:hypothetical protein